MPCPVGATPSPLVASQRIALLAMGWLLSAHGVDQRDREDRRMAWGDCPAEYVEYYGPDRSILGAYKRTVASLIGASRRTNGRLELHCTPGDPADLNSATARPRVSRLA